MRDVGCDAGLVAKAIYSPVFAHCSRAMRVGVKLFLVLRYYNSESARYAEHIPPGPPVL